MAARLRDTLAKAGPDPASRVAAIIGLETVFGTDLPRSAPFVAAVTDAYALLLAKGARAAADAT
jgi:fructuronate reductase